MYKAEGQDELHFGAVYAVLWRSGFVSECVCVHLFIVCVCRPEVSPETRSLHEPGAHRMKKMALGDFSFRRLAAGRCEVVFAPSVPQ